MPPSCLGPAQPSAPFSQSVMLSGSTCHHCYQYPFCFVFSFCPSWLASINSGHGWGGGAVGSAPQLPGLVATKEPQRLLPGLRHEWLGRARAHMAPTWSWCPWQSHMPPFPEPYMYVLQISVVYVVCRNHADICMHCEDPWHNIKKAPSWLWREEYGECGILS